MPTYKTVCISHNVADSGTRFTYDCKNVTFQPDEVVVRSVTARAGADIESFRVHCDMINDVMFSVATAADSVMHISPHLHYPLGRSVLGTWTFTLQDPTGTQLPTVADGFELYIHLEFIKH